MSLAVAVHVAISVFWGSAGERVSVSMVGLVLTMVVVVVWLVVPPLVSVVVA